MKARTKIILSVSALVAALAVATTSTFAWFTTSKNPTVEGFDLNAQSRTSNVSIAVAKDLDAAKALNAEDYVSNLKKETVTTVLTALGTPKLGAVTTADGIAFTDVAKQSVTANVSADGQTPTYLSLVIAFKADEAMDIKFVVGENSKATDQKSSSIPVKAWKDIAKDEYGTHEAIAKGADIPADVANAARVSFVPTNADASAWGTTAKIWEPNSDQGYSKENTNLANDYLNYLNGTDTVASSPAVATTDWSAAIVPNTNFKQATGATESSDPFYAYMQVNVWLEGWDGDCFNSILQQILTISLEFAGEVPAAN